MSADRSSSHHTQPVLGTARERVVVVVPGLAETGQREPEDVRRIVAGLEAACAEEVADRVDAPGDVVDEEDAHEPGPQQRLEAGVQRAAPGEAGEERDRERRDARSAGSRG